MKISRLFNNTKQKQNINIKHARNFIENNLNETKLEIQDEKKVNKMVFKITLILNK